MESEGEDDRATTGQVLKDQTAVEVVVLKTSMGALAARSGVSTKALRNTISRQKNGGRTPKLHITLHNQAIVDSAIRRAVCAALSSD